MSNYELIGSTNYNGIVPMHKYKSSATGLTVILNEVESPIVKGSIIVLTETTDDDGIPCALERMITFGSKTYPYNGVLNSIANRCLASGSKACTETDHTSFAMALAGSEGISKILPVYLDHILYPLLPDSAFLTEIYHVTGSGENKGVLYCEMEGLQNNAEYNALLELKRILYPNSACSASPGGCIENLRTSTTNEKVQEFHLKFYRPENICILITGSVEPDNIFKALEPFEKETLTPFERPWETSVEPLEESITKKYVFPSDDEEFGMVYIGWRGPNSINEIQDLRACSILLQYLCDSSISPIQRDVIQITDSFAGNVTHQFLENSVSGLIIKFSDVPVDKIELVFDKIQETLENISEGIEPIDLQRMANLIETEILKLRSILESQVHEFIKFDVLGDLKYGNTADDFEIRMNAVDQLENLKSVEVDYWLDLLKKYLVESTYAEIRAYPSIDEKEHLCVVKSELVDNNRNELGSDFNGEKEEELLQAVSANEIYPPTEILLNFEIPGIDGIHFYEVKNFRMNNGGNQLDVLPVYIEAFDIENTNFLYIKSIINTTELTASQRLYLPLLIELIMESPIESDIESLSYENVVTGLQNDIVLTQINCGIDCTPRFSCGTFSQSVSMILKLEPQKYEKGVEWLIKLLYFTKFDKDRIEIIVRNMIYDVSSTKRRAQRIVRDILNSMFYQTESNRNINFMIKQLDFLNEVLDDFNDSDRSQIIIDNLNEIREILIKPNNIAIQIIANWDKLAELKINLNEPWLKMKCDDENTKSLNVIPDWTVRKEQRCEENEISNGIIYGMAECEGTYFIQAVSSINDYMSPELPALLLFLQYFCQRESLVWRSIQTHGYANDFSIILQPNEGLLLLSINRATDICAAYKIIKTEIETHLENQTPFEHILLESARSSLIFDLVNRENSIESFISELFSSSFKNVSVNYNQEMVNLINDVTEDEMFAIGEKYVVPLFSDAAKTAIVCESASTTAICNSFEDFGRIISHVIQLNDITNNN